MSSPKVLSYLKWFLILFFLINICFEINYAISMHQIGNSVSRILMILILIAIILFKNIYTWIFAICFFIYGMYNITVIGTYASTSTSMEFTQALIHQVYAHGKAPVLVREFPLLFNFVSCFIFMTAKVRKWYGFASFKGKSQSSYLR